MSKDQCSIIECFLDVFQHDVEIQAALQKWINQENANSQKTPREEISEIKNILSHLSKAPKDSPAYEQIKKRAIRVLSVFNLHISKKDKKKDEKRIQHMSEIDSTIPVLVLKEGIDLLIYSQRAVEKLRQVSIQEAQKQKKLKDLLDICEALSSVQSKETKVRLLLREKLLQILDALVMSFGGGKFLTI